VRPEARHQRARPHLCATGNVDDVPIWGTGGLSLRGGRAKNATRKLTIDLLPGKNKVQVSALAPGGFALRARIRRRQSLRGE